MIMVGGNPLTIRILTITLLLATVFFGCVICFSKQKATRPVMPKFSGLSHEDRARLDEQRAIVAARKTRK